jgi:hypothetical protein
MSRRYEQFLSWDHWRCLSGASIRYCDKEAPGRTKCGVGKERILLEGFIRRHQ